MGLRRGTEFVTRGVMNQPRGIRRRQSVRPLCRGAPASSGERLNCTVQAAFLRSGSRLDPMASVWHYPRIAGQSSRVSGAVVEAI